MSEAENKTNDKAVPKGYKRKKDLPSVDFLLKNGAPDTADKPKSWADVYGPPVFTLVAFILSFFVFYYFIENHTTHRPIKLPRMPKQAAKVERVQAAPKKASSEL